MKNIALNALSAQGCGGASAFINLFAALDKVDNDNNYTVYVSIKQNEIVGAIPDSFKKVSIDYLISNPFFRILWEQIVFPLYLLFNKTDILYSVGNTTSILAPCRVVLCVENVNPFSLVNIEWSISESWRHKFRKFLGWLSAKRANKVRFPSNNAKDLLLKMLNLSESKCITIYHGWDGSALTEYQNTNKNDVLKQESYILTVAEIAPHKNLCALVEGFAILIKNYNYQGNLLLVGGVVCKNYYSKLKALITRLKLSERVVLEGRIKHEKIGTYYRCADIFVLPSIEESFGIPVIEAMGFGLPVAVSDSKLLNENYFIPFREICGDASDYFDPFDPTSIAESIHKIDSDREHREKLISKGIKQAENYRWEKTATSLVKIFSEVSEIRDISAKRVEYQICSNCVMDTSDQKIRFDKTGMCEYCNNYYKNIEPNMYPNEHGVKWFNKMVERIRKDGKSKDHDCLIGISGGADSSYLAYIAKEKFGLNPLIYHVDAGWNSKISTNNIARIVDGLKLDLYTDVIKWDEMKDLQLSFFKSQVPHLDAPQDHAFFASLYNFAVNNGFKYILTGGNYSTEAVLEPLEWIYHATDLRQLKDIHRLFGTIPLKTYPTLDIFKSRIFYRFFKGLTVLRPLNYFPYIKEEAMQELNERFDWEPYPHKHYESRFTRFFEGFWLPRKFGYDKRRTHFSSLILTNQMNREDALNELLKPAYDEEEMARDFEFVAKKLDLSVEELEIIMNGKNKTFSEYKNNLLLINSIIKLVSYLGSFVSDGYMVVEPAQRHRALR
jgi:N-acetyl sugar amidotransferase